MASIVLYLEDDSTQLLALDPVQVLTIGRHPDNGGCVACESVSSHHATVSRQADGWYVLDLGSSNGTRVNGAPIEEALLANGDRIGFGNIQGVFYENDSEAAAVVDVPAAPAAPAMPAPEVRAKPVPKKPAPPPVNRKLPGARLREANKGYPGEDTAGCMSTLIITGVCLFAVVLGLSLRHQQETGRNFITDTVNRAFGKLPRITIEKKVGGSSEK
jgi:predicted component of type VI protein secretion system